MPESQNDTRGDRLQGSLAARAKPVAVTVKLDEARYQKLKMLGLTTRRSSQDIIVQALDAYLDR